MPSCLVADQTRQPADFEPTPLERETIFIRQLELTYPDRGLRPQAATVTLEASDISSMLQLMKHHSLDAHPSHNHQLPKTIEVTLV